MSNWNQISADNLRGWVKQQEEMIATASAHLKELSRLKNSHAQSSSVPHHRTWLDEAIERESDALNGLHRSLEKSREWLDLAERDQLHDPNL